MAQGNESLLKASSDQRIERFHDSTLTGINDRSSASQIWAKYRSARLTIMEPSFHSKPIAKYG
jgi:hypothetical protein